MKRGPYRDGLDATLRRLRRDREALEVRAASLGADHRFFTRDVLTQLRGELDRPINDQADVERHEKKLSEFASVLDELRPLPSFPRARLVWAAIALAAGLPVVLGVGAWMRRYQHWREACPVSSACAADGSCSPHLGHLDATVAAAACHPASTSACSEAAACRHEGRCSLDGDRCVATRDEDCRAATYCEEYDGACVARSGHCVPQLETSVSRPRPPRDRAP